MKNKILAIIILILAGTQTVLEAEQTNVIDILRYIEQNLAPKDFIGEYTFKNLRSDGTLSEYKIRIQGRDADTVHLYFLEPPREKGREMLRYNDSIWTYIPSVGRVVRVEDRESFAGGDFSNADVLRVDWLDQYDATLLKETENQWIIELKANTTEAAYARMRLWVDKKNGMPLQQYFYDSNGTHLKTCLYGTVKSFGAIIRPARVVMKNMITGQVSEMNVLTLHNNQNIPDSRFSLSNLGN